MQLDLRSPARKLAAAAVLLASAGSYLALSATRYAASYLSDDVDPSRTKKAVSLDSGNAEYPYQLGRYYLLARQSPQDAIPWLRRAATLNPFVAKYWIDLAIGQQSLDDLEGEQQSLRRALAADPLNSDVAWQAANLYLALGASDEAMRQFHAVLENDAPLVPLTLNLCWKMRPDIDFLLANVIPPPTDTAFLDLLLSRNETAAAQKVWERITARQQALDRAVVFAYTRYLIQHREVSEAELAWQEAANLADLAAYQASPENLLVNGDFSLSILNGGFDWLHQKTAGVNLALDPNESHSGSHSLRVAFDGPPITDAGIAQMVPVEPDTSYEFSAFYKAQGMDGAGGMEFSIQDLYHENSLFMSEDLRDADFWKAVSGSFKTGPDTRIVLVHLARVPAGRPIRGKLWIDGLKLVRSDHSAETEAR